jgi:hypothetical protein
VIKNPKNLKVGAGLIGLGLASLGYLQQRNCCLYHNQKTMLESMMLKNNFIRAKCEKASLYFMLRIIPLLKSCIELHIR